MIYLRLLAIWLFVALSVAAPVTVLAQEVGAQAAAPDYQAWDNFASQVETTLDEAAASNEALAELRAELVVRREQFLAAQSANGDRIATLRDQIAALGAAPAEGETEPNDIAGRRQQLNTQLNEALAPVRAAEEAFTRANGLISQLDSIIRERQAEQTLRLDPTPLNPVRWPKALSALGMVGEAVVGEVASNYGSDTRRRALQDGLPVTLIMVLVGLGLILRAGHLVEWALSGIRHRQADTVSARHRVAVFLGSLFSVVFPVLGVLLVIAAIERTGLTATVGDLALRIAALAVTYIAAARWLAYQVFPKSQPPEPLLPAATYSMAEGRFYTVILAALFVIETAIRMLSGAEFLSNVLTVEVSAVLYFPVILVAGIMLLRLGQMLVRALRAMAEDETLPGNSFLLMKSVGRGAIAIGVAGPVLAAIGYVTAAAFLVFAAVLTLALFAVIMVLQRFIRDAYAMLTRDEEKATSLLPTLLGFGLVLLALPVLALIWGAQTSDLSEAWALAASGFAIGDTRISPTDFLIFAVVFVLGYMLTRLLQGTLKTQVLPKTRMDIGGRNAVVSGVGYVGIFLAALIAITSAGLDLSSLAIVAGALSVGIGFGLQTIVSNFVSGIILLVERPISEGDWIEVGGTMGVVRDISVRATRIETFDRRDVIVPNADLISTAVTNWTKGNLNARIIVPVGVAYGTDTKKVEKILQEVGEAHPMVIINPPPQVLFVGFGADSLDFEIRAIIRDVNFVVKAPSDMRHEIARRFAEEGIEIPFAQRDLWLRNPDALPGQAGPTDAA